MNMQNITANQLSIIMGISKKDALKKIVVAIERLKGNENMMFNEAILDLYDSNQSIDIDDFSKYLGRDLRVYLNDIKLNYLKNSSTRNHILDYPTTKIKPNKETGFYPKTISIPPALKSLLTKDQCVEIIMRWEQIYKNLMVEHGIIFKS